MWDWNGEMYSKKVFYLENDPTQKHAYEWDKLGTVELLTIGLLVLTKYDFWMVLRTGFMGQTWTRKGAFLHFVSILSPIPPYSINMALEPHKNVHLPSIGQGWAKLL